MKKKLFLHLVVNILLIVTVVGVTSVTLISATTNVFKKEDYAPIYRGTGKNTVSLMINVCWGTEYLDGILDTLKSYNVKATFFVGGSWASDNPRLLKRIADEGHEIGNHGYFHKLHSKLTYAQSSQDLLMCNKVVYEFCGIAPTLFAPPAGDFSTDTLKAAYDKGFKTIMWSRDTIDWRDKDAELVLTRATKNVTGGELILMHPTAHTLAALDKILKYYSENNLLPVTVSENIGEQWNTSSNTTMDSNLLQKN